LSPSNTVIHLAFSLTTSIKWLGFIPDPLFRLEIRKQHKAKHGSDTESYDKKGSSATSFIRFFPLGKGLDGVSNVK
jgi:hypothetical protein